MNYYATLFSKNRLFNKLVVFQIAEFDSPAALLANPDSAFSKLVQAMEIEAEDHYLIE